MFEPTNKNDPTKSLKLSWDKKKKKEDREENIVMCEKAMHILGSDVHSKVRWQICTRQRAGTTGLR